MREEKEAATNPQTNIFALVHQSYINTFKSRLCFVKTHRKGAGILTADAPAKCLERVQMRLQPKMKRVFNLKSWAHIALRKERFWSTIQNTWAPAINQTRAGSAPSSGRPAVAAAIIFSVRHCLVLWRAFAPIPFYNLGVPDCLQNASPISEEPDFLLLKEQKKYSLYVEPLR